MESTIQSSRRTYRVRRDSYGRSRGRRVGGFTSAVNRITKRVLDRNEEFKYVAIQRYGPNTTVAVVENLRPTIISGPSKYGNRIGNNITLKNMDLNLTVNCTSAYTITPFPLFTFNGLCRVTIGRFKGYNSFDSDIPLNHIFYLPYEPNTNPALAYCHATIRPDQVECLKDELFHVSPFAIPSAGEDQFINPASFSPSSFGFKYHHRLDIPININPTTNRSTSEKDAFFICIQLASFLLDDNDENPLQIGYSYSCRYSYTDH